MLHNIYIYISMINFQCIQFDMTLHYLSTNETFNNIIHNSYLCKLQHVRISMIMYDQENVDHYNFIVMWFLDIGDDAHDVICGNDDGDETGIINLFFVY